MKEYHLYLWIIALVGLMTSCSQDETDALPTDTNANRVTLTASLPEDFAQIGTRALPSASDHQLRCILEVWTQDPSPALKYREEKVGLTGDNVVFDFKIDKGKYDCLFWADFIGTGAKNMPATIGGLSSTHYDDKFYATNNTTNGLKAISIIENDIFNTDARDAFFGHYVLDKKEAAAVTNPSIPALTRPFAKLTIKEKDPTNYYYCSGLTAKYDVPSTFNVLDGTVSGTVQVTCSSKSTEPQTLFSNYILTDASSTLGSIDLTFTGREGKELLPVTIPAGIPLKRNYKTNAIGRLISEKPVPIKDVKLTVDINSDWATSDVEYDNDKAKVGDYYYEDGTWSTALNAQKKCIGIVYEVNADGKSGKIMGLMQTNSEKWSTEDIVTGATNTTDGRANMTTIANLIANSNNSKSWDTYPIFKWVTEQNNNTDNWDATNDKWYLPAKDELSAFYTAYDTYGKDNFNAKITTAGGTAFNNIYHYPSSTESSSTNFWKTAFSSGSTDTDAKTYNYVVRCIRTF